MTDQLTQWARSLFNEISNPASAGNRSTAAQQSGSRRSGTANENPPVDTYSETLAGKIGASPIAAPRQAGEDTSDPASPAPDFRYRPVTTSVRRRG